MKTVKRAARLLALFAALLLVTAGTFPAAAQTSEEAVAANEQGDHATILRGLRIHAEQGDAGSRRNMNGAPARPRPRHFPPCAQKISANSAFMSSHDRLSTASSYASGNPYLSPFAVARGLVNPCSAPS